MEENNTLELEQQPIGKLLIKYAIPAIVATVAMSIYNIIDSIFIGHGVGPLAISGLALTFPLINLSGAFGSMVGVGASTLLSVKLGQKDYAKAQKILSNLLIMNIILGLSLGFIAYIFLDPILYFFGASDNTIGYARDYMQIILIGNVITHMYMGLNALLRSAGHPNTAMKTTILSVIVNTVLDALFIFVFHWGIRGAALATVFGQIVAMVWQFVIFNNPKELIHFRKGTYKLDLHLVSEMVSIGMAPFLMNLASSMIIVLINQSLMKYGGDLYVGAYGIDNRVIVLAVMIVLGFCQAMQPIAGYNYGAGNFSRVEKVLKLTLTCAMVVTCFFTLIAQFYPEYIVSAFTSSETLKTYAIRGLHILTLLFPLAGIQIVTANFFQSIGVAKKAIFLSLTRQVIFIIPFLLIFPSIWGTDGVWFAFPAADGLSAFVSIYLLRRQLIAFKKL